MNGAYYKKLARRFSKSERKILYANRTRQGLKKLS
jgi:hypothetical protein